MKVEGHIEFTIVQRSADKVVSEMPLQSGIKNPYGTVHAGATLWMADVTATVLAMGDIDASDGMKGFPLAISVNANLLSNQKDGIFRAVSTYVKQGRTVSVIRTMVYGAGDKIIADVTTSHVMSV